LVHAEKTILRIVESQPVKNAPTTELNVAPMFESAPRRKIIQVRKGYFSETEPFKETT
jgi:hypothetical protein